MSPGRDEMQTDLLATRRICAFYSDIGKFSVAEHHQLMAGTGILYPFVEIVRRCTTGPRNTRVRGAHGFLQVPNPTSSTLGESAAKSVIGVTQKYRDGWLYQGRESGEVKGVFAKRRE